MANEKNQPEKVPGQDIPAADRAVGPPAETTEADQDRDTAAQEE